LKRNHRGGRLPRIRERPLIVEKRLVLVEEVQIRRTSGGRAGSICSHSIFPPVGGLRREVIWSDDALWPRGDLWRKAQLEDPGETGKKCPTFAWPACCVAQPAPIFC